MEIILFLSVQIYKVHIMNLYWTIWAKYSNEIPFTCHLQIGYNNTRCTFEYKWSAVCKGTTARDRLHLLFYHYAWNAFKTDYSTFSFF